MILTPFKIPLTICNREVKKVEHLKNYNSIII